jgi:hypothetical protein
MSSAAAFVILVPLGRNPADHPGRHHWVAGGLGSAARPVPILAFGSDRGWLSVSLLRITSPSS